MYGRTFRLAYITGVYLAESEARDMERMRAKYMTHASRLAERLLRWLHSAQLMVLFVALIVSVVLAGVGFVMVRRYKR